MTLRRGAPPDPPSVEEGPAPEEPPRPYLPPDKLMVEPVGTLGANAAKIWQNNRAPPPALRGKSRDILLSPEVFDPDVPMMPKSSTSEDIRRRMTMLTDPGTTAQDVRTGQYWESILGTDKPGTRSLPSGMQITKRKGN